MPLKFINSQECENPKVNNGGLHELTIAVVLKSSFNKFCNRRNIKPMHVTLIVSNEFCN